MDVRAAGVAAGGRGGGDGGADASSGTSGGDGGGGGKGGGGASKGGGDRWVDSSSSSVYDRPGSMTAEEAATKEEERYQLVTELQLRSRRLEEAREEVVEMEAARAAVELRAGVLERERDAALGELSETSVAGATAAVELATLREHAAALEARAAAAEGELAAALAAVDATDTSSAIDLDLGTDPLASAYRSRSDGTAAVVAHGAGGTVQEAVANVRRTAAVKVPAPRALHPAFFALRPTPCTLHPELYTLSPEP